MILLIRQIQKGFLRRILRRGCPRREIRSNPDAQNAFLCQQKNQIPMGYWEPSICSIKVSVVSFRSIAGRALV